MLVPATTVPVTIVGAFAAMYLLGYTINTTSLFALVLAIGIVVDDAIVIVEGVSRHMEAGLSRREASIKAMSELTGRIIGITLVLMAVFLPVAMMSGLTGKMYQQFSLVIAAAGVRLRGGRGASRPFRTRRPHRPSYRPTPVSIEGVGFRYAAVVPVDRSGTSRA